VSWSGLGLRSWNAHTFLFLPLPPGLEGLGPLLPNRDNVCHAGQIFDTKSVTASKVSKNDTADMAAAAVIIAGADVVGAAAVVVMAEEKKVKDARRGDEEVHSCSMGRSH
jgi:hypothetical protein